MTFSTADTGKNLPANFYVCIFRTALYRRFQRFQIKHYIKHSLGAYFRVDGLPVVGVVGFVYRSNADVLVIGDRSLLEQIIYRSEEHTSELQSLMRISYAVFCLKKKNY